MSVETLAIVLHHSKAKSTDKLVLIGIANHAGDGGAWPSIATLARYANVSERTVQRAVDALARLGELHVERQAGGTPGMKDWQRPNRYDVTLSCPPGCDRSVSHRVKPLASAPAQLWIEGVTPVSPGDTHVTGGVTPTSPGGVTPTSPEPSIEPTSNHNDPAASTTDHAHAIVPGWCDECGLTFDAHLIAIERGTFELHNFHAQKRSRDERNAS